MVFLHTMTTDQPGRVDALDAALIELLAAEPRVGVLEASRRLRVARGTVQARLERLQERGVQAIDRPRVTGSHGVHRYHHPFGINRQDD